MSKKTIRYVVLSDLHLGQDRSVLTAVKEIKGDPAAPDPEKTEPALNGLMECLRYLVENNAPVGEPESRPTLILLGDIMEQAFTDIDIAGPIFQRFVEEWKGKDGQSIFKDVVFIPGNHDHNMWEFTRMYQYWKCLKEQPEKVSQVPPVNASCPSIRHTTALRTGYPSNEDLIGLLINRKLAAMGAKPLDVTTYYPTFALVNETKERAVLFNHGHYFEPIYQAMTTLLTMVTSGTTPQKPTAENIEHNNFGWLDFIWSIFGRQGAVGHEAERLYDSLGKHPDNVKAAARGLVKTLLKSFPDFIEKPVSNFVADKIVDYVTKHVETISYPNVLSDKTSETMQQYWHGPLLEQINSDQELSRTIDRTLVFGHTHKPFLWPHASAMFTWPPDKARPFPNKVYNTGGWVIDPLSADVQPDRGGSCLLLNDELDITSVRFYRQVQDDGVSKIKTLTTDPSEFHQTIEDLIANDSSRCFERFKATVAKSVEAHRDQPPGR